MFYVVSYDIPDDKRRISVSKTLLDFGARVQYSVFECIMDDNSHQELMNRLSRIVVEEEDKIRVYALCAKCEGQRCIYSLRDSNDASPARQFLIACKSQDSFFIQGNKMY